LIVFCIWLTSFKELGAGSLKLEVKSIEAEGYADCCRAIRRHYCVFPYVAIKFMAVRHVSLTMHFVQITLLIVGIVGADANETIRDGFTSVFCWCDIWQARHPSV